MTDAGTWRANEASLNQRYFVDKAPTSPLTVKRRPRPGEHQPGSTSAGSHCSLTTLYSAPWMVTELRSNLISFHLTPVATSTSSSPSRTRADACLRSLGVTHRPRGTRQPPGR